MTIFASFFIIFDFVIFPEHHSCFFLHQIRNRSRDVMNPNRPDAPPPLAPQVYAFDPPGAHRDLAVRSESCLFQH